ncbi:uncharacterized protein HMPREF1541_11150 [Cyphellophora europaea CBS 101466]|uniref:Isochorismatase-like domain-containing protein n=1 Tax=Cyphellophora europaea (strain CBS 101466) TaxID=1220924 RepID=W2S562_CYPE1|nr:uncharacterized protein HMPREF1541_11150 [Cyphellophora europaea CBS 101466]ETN43826.1 hypothetical protein HMPREF1541_11150 [Cyphellophora europaea CBS 101466]
MADRKALVLVDPLNDFLHDDGKLFPLLKESLTATAAIDHINEAVAGARAAGVPIYYGLHQQFREGNYDGWRHMRDVHVRGKDKHVFAGWGGEIFDGLEPELTNGDVVVSRHWNSSSFVNTDLDYQLRQREITHLVMAGMVANTCLEATARDATEKGYRVTFLKDTTASFSNKLKEAGEIVWPTLFEEVLTTKEWLVSIGQQPSNKL